MTNQSAMRAAVIGLGRMGMHHVRACTDASNLNLVAVFDQRADVTRRVAEDTGSQAAASLESLHGQIDVAVVAVSTQHHADSAVSLLQSGVSCLVEKPISATEAEAVAMIEAASDGGAHLRIGHVERFNPAITLLKSTLDADLKNGDKIESLSARRLNLAADRTYDVDAVLDLMIHDLDLLNTMAVGTITSVECASGSTEHRTTATLKLDSGVSASFDVSRVAETQDRSLTIETTGSTLDLDFTAKTVTRTVNGMAEPLGIDAIDPLRAQLASFIAAVGDAESDVATGQEGLAALQLANRIRTSAGLL